MKEPRPFLGLPRPPKPTSDHLYWMAHAALAASRSPDHVLQSGACAVREDRLLISTANGFPQGVQPSAARRKDPLSRSTFLLGAPLLLVSKAAAHGISLRGADVYLWPILEGAPSAAVLTEARVSCVYIPDDIPLPSRLENEMHLTRIALVEAGIQLTVIDMSDGLPILGSPTPGHEAGATDD